MTTAKPGAKRKLWAYRYNEEKGSCCTKEKK